MPDGARAGRGGADLGPAAAAVRPAADEYTRDNPIDIRHVGPLSVEVERDPSLTTPDNVVWLRADGDAAR